MSVFSHFLPKMGMTLIFYFFYSKKDTAIALFFISPEPLGSLVSL